MLICVGVIILISIELFGCMIINNLYTTIGQAKSNLKIQIFMIVLNFFKNCNDNE